MLLKDRHELEHFVRQSIQVDKRNWKPNNVVFKARKLLANFDAVDNGDIRNYRLRGIPETVLVGAAIAYSAFQSDESQNVIGSDGELLERARDIYERLSGMGIGKVDYHCKLTRSEKYEDLMDAEITTVYQHPMVHPDHGTSVLPIQIFSDVTALDDFSYAIEYSGPGIVRASSAEPRLELHHRTKQFSSGEKREDTRAEFIYNVRIDSKANASTQIRLIRKLKGAFRLKPIDQPVGGIDREHAGFRINNPVRSLSLTVQFPEDLFPRPDSVPVNIHAWGPGSLRMDEVDYLKTTSFLALNGPVPKGIATWVWQSTFPLMMGMAYALTYNVSDVWTLMQEARKNAGSRS